MRENEENLRDFWDIITQNNIYIMKVLGEKRRREKGSESLFKEIKSEQIWGRKWTSRSKKLPKH